MSAVAADSDAGEVDVGEKVARKMVAAVYGNVIAGAIMSVIIGAILLSLGMIVVDDFLTILPENTTNTTPTFHQDQISGPLGTAFGLGGIALIVPVVAGIVNLLMGAFGGFFNGGNGGR